MPCAKDRDCPKGECCSDWGFCGPGEHYCGPPYVEGSGFEYTAHHGEDSRLIAYVGNWQKVSRDAFFSSLFTSARYNSLIAKQK